MWLRRDVLKLIPAALLGLTDRYNWRAWAKRQEEPEAMAAITARWHASTDVFDLGANWDGGVVPGAGVDKDTVICDGVSQVSMLTNVDRSGDFPTQRFITMPAYGGNVGSPGSPLIMAFDSGTAQSNSRFLHRGSGRVWFQGEAGDVQDVFVDSSHLAPTAAMTIDGVVRNVFVKRGRVEIASTCSVTGVMWVCGHGAHIVMAAQNGAETPPAQILVTKGALWNSRITSAAAGNFIHVAQGGSLVQYGRILDETTVIHTGGDFTYEPSEEPTASHNPYVFSDVGALRLAGSAYDIEFDSFIIGPYAAISGSAETVSGTYSPLSTYIDMREDYP